MGIQGYAGTGKTTALTTVRVLAEGQGVEVQGFAVSAQAAMLLEQETGISSQTLASALAKLGRAQPDRSRERLWIVDEASLLGNRDAYALFQAAVRAQARIVLVGDSDQLPSVEAGRAFRLLSERGLERAVMDAIMRQKDPTLLQAVEATIHHDSPRALRLLQPKIRVEGEATLRLDAVAQDYLGRDPKTRAGTLLLTASNHDRRLLNDRIRSGLRAEAALSGEDQAAHVLISRGFTEAERRESHHYKVGDVVRIGRAYQKLGLSKGQYLTVAEIQPQRNRVVLEAADGQPVIWQPHKAPIVEVYASEPRALAVGDAIRWSRNDAERGFKNGDRAEVIGLEAGRALVRFQRTQLVESLDLSRDRHWEHGYVSTVHSAQGQTSDHVVVHIDTERRSLTGHESWYVALSRARYSAAIYTDSAERLPAAVQRSMQKDSAIAAVRPGVRALEQEQPRVGK